MIHGLMMKYDSTTSVVLKKWQTISTRTLNQYSLQMQQNKKSTLAPLSRSILIYSSDKVEALFTLTLMNHQYRVLYDYTCMMNPIIVKSVL